MKTLRTETRRTYTFIPYAQGADPTEALYRRTQRRFLPTGTRVGKEMKVDLLIVPQILDWRRARRGQGRRDLLRRREHGFLSDRRAWSRGDVVSRSHFREKQIGLSDNLMNFDTFLKRGGKWVSTQELALEGVDKMIREFGL